MRTRSIELVPSYADTIYHPGSQVFLVIQAAYIYLPLGKHYIRIATQYIQLGLLGQESISRSLDSSQVIQVKNRKCSDPADLRTAEVKEKIVVGRGEVGIWVSEYMGWYRSGEKERKESERERVQMKGTRYLLHVRG